MKPRHGISLIEVVGVMMMGSVILGVTVSLMATLLRTESATRERIHRRAVLDRLGEQFRRDVHAARTAAEDAAGSTWKFTRAPEHVVTYRADSDELVRLEIDGQGTRRQESFSLPPDATAKIEIPGETSASVVSLSIIPSAGESGRPSHRMVRFDAVLASDHRFARLEASLDEKETPSRLEASLDEKETPSNEETDGRP